MTDCIKCQTHIYSVYYGGFKQMLPHYKYCKHCGIIKLEIPFPDKKIYRTSIEKNNSPVTRNKGHAD